MNRVLYQNRCKCNEEVSITKKRKSNNRSEGKAFLYPNQNEITSKIAIPRHPTLGKKSKSSFLWV